MLSVKSNGFSLNKTTKIMLFDQNGLIKSMLNEEMREFSELTYNFLSRNIQEKSVCLGLLMEHNLYIPSIILSLRKLNLTFIFLEMENKENPIRQLNINWILSFQPNLSNFTVQDSLKELFLHKNTINLINNISYKNILCVMASSGTTGDPKFIKIENKCIESNVDCLSKKWDINESDIIFFGTPLTFDPSLIELLLALSSGATLVIVPKKTKINPNALYKALFCHNSITVLQMVPSVFLRWSLSQIQTILESKLKILAFGGEIFPENLLKCPKNSVNIYNLYGITEVSCWATMYKVQNDVCLGEVLDDTIIEIREKNCEGEGEIFIGSDSRFCYIIGEQEKSNFRATGDLGKITEKGLVYLGRKNDVIKRFGHRICLRKNEEIIAQETGLQNKIVYSNSKLLIFFVSKYDNLTKGKILDKLRVKLLHILPKETFPDYIDLIPKFPLTNHGKINKKYLEQIYLNQEKKPENPVELFRDLWMKYLGISEETLNFFEMGGNSISAIQLLEEFTHKLNADFPDLITNLFEKTLQDCLNCLSNIRPKPEGKQQTPTIPEIKNTIPMYIKWKYNFRACVDSTPFFFSHKGYFLVASGSFSHIFSVLNALNGEEISSFTLPEPIESSPCLSPCKNYLFFGCFDGKFYCIDYFNKKIKWFFQTGDRIKNSPCLYQNCLIFGSYDKYLYCLSLDGKLSWKLHLKAGIVSNPIQFENKLYIATILGSCNCISDSKIIWTFNCNRPIFGSGCIYKNSVIWPDVTGIIHAFCLDSGLELWQFTAESQIYSSLLQKNDTLIFGCHDHNLYVIDISEKPQVKFLVNLNSAITSTPCLANNEVITATNCGDLYCICLKSGIVLGHLQLGEEIFSGPCYGAGTLFVGCRDNYLYCINLGK